MSIIAVLMLVVVTNYDVMQNYIHNMKGVTNSVFEERKVSVKSKLSHDSFSSSKDVKVCDFHFVAYYHAMDETRLCHLRPDNHVDCSI
jgi:hypothetical protein